MFFENGAFDPREAANRIADEAKADGVHDVTVEQAEDWYVIRAGSDWLRGSDDAFSQLLPHPASGPNAVRWEVVVTAFASQVMTVAASPAGVTAKLVTGHALDDETSTWLLGRLMAKSPPRAAEWALRVEVPGPLSQVARLIAFRP